MNIYNVSQKLYRHLANRQLKRGLFGCHVRLEMVYWRHGLVDQC